MNDRDNTPLEATGVGLTVGQPRPLADANPYLPPAHAELPSQDAGPRSWSPIRRNLVACVAITTAWVLVTTPLVFWGIPITGEYVLLLLLACGAAATWANVSLGPKIGWSQGGLAVVFLAVTACMTVYAAIALVVASSLPF